MPNTAAMATTASDPRRQIAVDDVRNPMLCGAIALWNAKRGERLFPARGDLTFRAMAPFARNAVLLRVLDGGAEFEFRLVGDAVTQAKGRSFQGMTLTEAAPLVEDHTGSMRRAYQAVCGERRPTAFRGWTGPAIGQPVFRESVYLPLGEDGQTVDHILAIGVYASDARHA